MSENPRSKGRGAFHLADDLKLIVALTLIAAACIFIPYVSNTVVRSVMGLIFLLFIPGYAFIAALFPGRSDIDAIERVAFSLAINIALVGLIGIGLNLTAWGVRPEPVFASLACFTILCVAIAGVRRQRLTPNERLSPDFGAVLRAPNKLLPESDRRLNRTVMAIFIIAIIVSAVTIAYIMVALPQKETFTEFYILGANGQASDYPTNYTLGQQKPVTVGIANHESHDQTYVLEVRLDGGTNTTTLYSQQIALANNQRWEQPVMVKPDQAGNHIKMTFLLYLDNNRTTPYLDTHLWVNVTK